MSNPAPNLPVSRHTWRTLKRTRPIGYVKQTPVYEAVGGFEFAEGIVWTNWLNFERFKGALCVDEAKTCLWVQSHEGMECVPERVFVWNANEGMGGGNLGILEDLMEWRRDQRQPLHS